MEYKNDDLILNDMDFIPEGACDKEVKEILNNAVVKLDNVLEEIKELRSLVAYSKQVNKDGSQKKKRGRKPCRMYYDGKLVTTEEIIYLKDKMDVPLSKILDDFKYINERSEIVTDRKTCRIFLNNRLNKHMGG